ncbi:MAG: CinA family nicotinamide mononucleotide deamidase-related protein [Chitinophagaceae bacterium]|nr:CinA family nicotinamide mononucleotide deamidase-related protein [Chitinophagaceae bacterium]
MNQITASIITIGDELLIGQTIDTNSAFIGQELNKMGVWVKRRVAVGDLWDDIWQALDEESQHSDIIIITGGLGPTADDITKPLLCKYFGGKLVVNEDVLNHVKYLFEKVYRRPGPILERNLKQAEVPDVCTVLHNARGSAPGMWFEKQIVTHAKDNIAGTMPNRIFVSLPGVPHEMKGLVEKEVIPRLKAHFETLPVILHKTMLTAGTGESMLAEHIREWEERLPTFLKLAYLPHYGMVRLRITGTGDERQALETELSEQFSKLKVLVREWLVVDDDLSLQEAIAALLRERNKTVATTESCTGGFIAHLLSRDAGSSRTFKGSIVSYDNQVKTDLLGVSEEVLKEHGAVSEQTVRQMVVGGLQKLKTDFVIATSGIMGPDGGTEQKPVGMVWIAVGNAEKIKSHVFNFRFERNRNIEQTAIAALDMLRKFIVTNS